MKNIYFILAILIFNYSKSIDVGEVFQLPKPATDGGMTLNEALNKRKTSRDFDPTIQLTLEQISQALWSCYGENRPNGFKTTPSTKSWYPLLIYVFLEEGVFLYEASQHSITKILDGDYRSYTGTQKDIVTKAGANFVLIGDLSKKSGTYMDDSKSIKLMAIHFDSGHCTMGLYLFAAANNLKGVVRGNIDENSLLKLLGLKKEDYIFSLAFSLGY